MEHRDVVRGEFDRAAELFSKRTEGRFSEMPVVGFSRVRPGQKVLEVGAGTASFLTLFADQAGQMIAVDLTPGMLERARELHPDVDCVLADGARLPLESRSVDLAMTAQALHHIWKPVEILKELRRVVTSEGSVLVVDSVAPERFEEAERMNQLERIRDPSHAAFRSPSTMKVIVRQAGLELVDEHPYVGEQRLSQWMWPGEFPEERIEAVRSFIEIHGHETGMKFERDGDDWVFERRRIMLLARR